MNNSFTGDVRRICQRIDWLRREKGLTQEAMAAALNISQPAVSKYLRDRLPPADILYRIARLGGTTMEWIMTGHKDYLPAQSDARVREQAGIYDTDWQLIQQLNGLAEEQRQAVVQLIRSLANQGR